MGGGQAGQGPVLAECELPAVQAIDRAAMRMFCDIGMPAIAQYDPWPLGDLAARQQAGRQLQQPGRGPLGFAR